ncbi:MAG: hypothetical protein ACUVXJ_13815 [Phycisphaerae bacterium]
MSPQKGVVVLGVERIKQCSERGLTPQSALAYGDSVSSPVGCLRYASMFQDHRALWLPPKVALGMQARGPVEMSCHGKPQAAAHIM